MNAIILAHGGAAETVASHTPNWEAAFDGLIFISPSDDPLPGSLPIGLSCRNGVGSIERLIFAMAMASRFPVCAIIEYDVLMFPVTGMFAQSAKNVTRGDEGTSFEMEFRRGPDWQLTLGKRMKNLLFCSEVFPNQDPPHIFAGQTYGHAPWIATGQTWWKLLTTGSDLQHGFPDRWLANAAQRANVSLRGMEGAYSRDRDFDVGAARIARLRGAPCIHGVKTKEQCEEIVRPEIVDVLSNLADVVAKAFDETIHEDEQRIPSELGTEGE